MLAARRLNRFSSLFYILLQVLGPFEGFCEVIQKNIFRTPHLGGRQKRPLEQTESYIHSMMMFSTI